MNRLLSLILLISLWGCKSTEKDNVRNDNTENHSFDSEYKISHEDSVLLKQYNSDKKHAILIKGKIKNSSAESWILKSDGYLGHQSIKIQVQPDGSFQQILPIEGLANLYLMLNHDAININVEPNNIVVLNWDEKDFGNTIRIGSPNKRMNKNLNFNIRLHEKFRIKENLLQQDINQKNYKSKDEIYAQINDLFNAELTELNKSEAQRDLFFYKLYYIFQGFLFDAKLMDSYRLTLNKSNNLDISFQRYFSQIPSNRFLDNHLFHQCPEYREFLYQYISNEKLFDDVMITNSKEMRNSNGELIEVPYTLTKFCDFQNDKGCSEYLWKEYYKAMYQIGISSIRDWYITYFLINSFKNQPFNEIEAVCNDFLVKCQTTVYKDTITSTYRYYKEMNSEIKAPEFKLTDENGKLVSLSEFRGKVVYLDFWGTSCAPCLNDIKNYIPTLHDRYKNDDVAFINICVDSDENRWKSFIDKLNMEGVNLIAEGFTTNQVCKDYNIDAIPHYLIIDKRGYLREINAPKPKKLLDLKTNIIDKLIKE